MDGLEMTFGPGLTPLSQSSLEWTKCPPISPVKLSKSQP
eukprot:COSAG02_NODE_1538_length_12042_cov_323.842083_15_plen_38_part_01